LPEPGVEVDSAVGLQGLSRPERRLEDEIDEDSGDQARLQSLAPHVTGSRVVEDEPSREKQNRHSYCSFRSNRTVAEET